VRIVISMVQVSKYPQNLDHIRGKRREEGRVRKGGGGRS